MLYDILYTKDSTGNIRTWQMEQENGSYRTISGVLNGSLVYSNWTYTEPKNIGKKNETSAEEQAELEILAKYKKQLKTGYSENIEDAGKTAYVEPLLANKYKDRFHKIKFNEPYLLQIKFNGARCIARKDGLWSRKGEKFLTCPHIEESLKPFFKIYPDAILDGELFNFELRQNLNEIMSLIRKTVKITDEVLELSKGLVKFYTYDGYGFGYEHSHPYIQRKNFIDKIEYEYLEKVKDYNVSSHEDINKIYQSFIEENHEGAMLRRANSPYKFGRSNDLLKIKPDDDDEGIVLDIKEGKGNWSGTAKTVTLQWSDKTFDATLKGSYEETLTWWENPEYFIGKQITFKYNGFTGLGTPNYAIIDPSNCNPT